MNLRIAILLVALQCFLASKVLCSQSIYGLTGLNKIPNASVIEDGKAIFSTSYFKDDERISRESNIPQGSFFFLIGVLPFMEIGYRMTAVFYDGTYKPTRRNVDQNLNLKFRIVKERKYVPEIALGVQDVMGNRIFQSSFIVASKKIEFREYYYLKPTIGFGNNYYDWAISKILERDAANYRFQGVFAGAELHLSKYALSSN
jgi:hypothetical protein